ncbi:MAG TPA: DnaJ C-terminal domain-containing protein [Micromonosporaceae bacterium]|nr:DnaJ C-terminal domain-containing protein [Micromonosporaceae bacterium]
MAAKADFYEILGVDHRARPEEIQRAYRRLARRYHPDVNPEEGAEERFKEINEAYAVLSDPVQRSRYDAARQPRFADYGSESPRRPGGSRGRRVWARAGGNPFDLADWWFGAGGHGFGARARDGADAEADFQVSVEEAYLGGRRQVTLTGLTGTELYEVEIPPGVTTGTRIRLPGLGLAGRGGGNGDLYLVVRLAPHPRYQVTDRDVSVDLPVAPWEAALGATVTVPTPAGGVQVVLPAGSSSGRRLRLRGRGLPNPHGPPGDLYATVRIVIPEHLSLAERRLFQRLAQRSQFDARADL